MTLLVTLALLALGACAAGPSNPAPVALPAPAAPPASSPAAAPAVAGATPGPVAVRDVDVAALKAALEQPAPPLLVDVRTPSEFAGGHVPGAKNVPIDELDARLGELGAPGAPVYVICQSGGRSARASASLAEKGYPAVNVTGGTGAWRAAGYAVE